MVTEETEEEENSTLNVEVLETEGLGPETLKLFDIIEDESNVQVTEEVTENSDDSTVQESESESEFRTPPDIVARTARRTGEQSKKLRGPLDPNYSTSDSSLSGDEITRERRPANLFEFYKRINTPQRLAHMIVKFRLQDYIGAEE